MKNLDKITWKRRAPCYHICTYFQQKMRKTGWLMSKGGNPEGTNSMQLGPRKSFINSFKCTRSQHLPCPYPLLYSPFSPHSLPFCPPLTAPAVSMRRQYLRATENLALHVNYISGSLPRALRLSPHVKNKGIMQKSINSLNTFYMVHSLECIQRWNLLWKRLSEVSWVT